LDKIIAAGRRTAAAGTATATAAATASTTRTGSAAAGTATTTAARTGTAAAGTAAATAAACRRPIGKLAAENNGFIVRHFHHPIHPEVCAIERTISVETGLLVGGLDLPSIDHKIGTAFGNRARQLSIRNLEIQIIY
jgi:hypothetical protein